MKKVPAALAAAVVTVGLLAGCSAGGDPGGDGKITISYAHWGNTSEADTIAAMIKAFEKANPDITIEDNWIQSDYEKTLLTSIASNQAPVVMQTSETFLPNIYKSFEKVDLNPDDFFTPNAAKGMQFDGAYYGTPFVLKPKVMAVNLKLFRDAGLPEPSLTDPISVADFEEYARALTSGSGDSRVYGSAPLDLRTWAYATGGAFFTPDGSSCALDTPTFNQAVQLLIDSLNPETGFAPTSIDAEGQDMFYWLSIGRLGMQPDYGPWDIPKLIELGDPDLQIVPVPGDGSEIEINGLGISAAASDAEKKAAHTFVEFMSTDIRAQSLLTNETSSLGVPVTAEGIEAFKKVDPDLNLAAFEQSATVREIGADVPNFLAVVGNVANQLRERTAMGVGNEDPLTVLKDLQSKCPDGLINI